MGYILTAKIDEMSRNEAKAVVRAILDMHGSDLVYEVTKQRDYEIENAEPENDVAFGFKRERRE